MGGGNNMRKRYVVRLVVASILIMIAFVDIVNADDATSTISFSVMPGGLALTSTPVLSLNSVNGKSKKEILSANTHSNTIKVTYNSKNKLEVEDYRGHGTTPWRVYAQLSLNSDGAIHSESEIYDTGSEQKKRQKLSFSSEPINIMSGSATVGKETTKLVNSRLDVNQSQIPVEDYHGTVTWTLVNTAAN